MEKKKPLRITIAAIIIFAISFAALIFAAINPTLVPNFLIDLGVISEELESSAFITGAWIFLSIGLIGYMASAVGILLARSWGRILFMIWGFSDVIFGILFWPNFIEWVGFVALFATLIWALTGKDASVYFGKDVSLEDWNPTRRLSNLLGFLGGFIASILGMLPLMKVEFGIAILDFAAPSDLLTTLMAMLIIVLSFTGFLASLSPLISTTRDPQETGSILIWCGTLGIIASQIFLGSFIPGAYLLLGAGPLMIIAGFLRRFVPKDTSQAA
jgi:hypothetical protein